MPSTLRRLAAALPLLASLALSKPAFEGPKPPLRRIVDAPDLPFDLAHFDNLIVGGGPADPASSSFAVALVTDYRGELFQFCGGTLIKQRFVVTAAHCVEAGYSMKAVVGRYKLSDTSQGAIIDVAESFVFPTYDPESMAGDIAILRLADPVDPAIAKPINILPPSLNNKVVPGTSLRVLGWGLQAEEGNNLKEGSGAATASGSDVLRSVDVPVVSNADCNKDYFAVTEKNPILDEQVCAGINNGGLDSCQGDSGGPLVAIVNGEPFLFGVVSWGIGCARPNIPGVYTRVLSHSNWVTSKMMLTTSLFPAKAQPGNMLITATDKTATLPVTFESLGTELLSIALNFVNSSSSFSADHVSLDIAKPDTPSSVVLKYHSSEPKSEAAFLELGLNSDNNGGDLYSLRGLALGPANFANLDSWYTGGDSSWAKEEEDDSLSSAETENSATSCALKYFQGQGKVSFDWKVSSEEGYDLLYVLIDNKPVDAITGEADWDSKSYDLTGDHEHSLAFCYIKDHSVGEGEDRGYVRDVSFTAAGKKKEEEGAASSSKKKAAKKSGSSGLRGRKTAAHSA